jgi:hypothetical protein
MTDIKSNLDRLEDSASNFYKRGQNDGASSALSSGDALQIASDLRGAIRDIQNLRDYVWQLEKTATAAANESKGIASALLAAILPDLDRRIDEHVKTAFDKNQRLDAFEARLETFEGFKDDLEPDDIPGLESYIDDRIDSAASNSDSDRDDETRDTVRDMIRDGDIVVTVDVA